MEWQPVLHIHASARAGGAISSGAAVHETGWIVESSSKVRPVVLVELHPSGETRVVQMDWIDRFELFETFVAECRAVFRLSVSLVNGRVAKYTLYVAAAAFARQMTERGWIDGELAALALLKRHALDAHLPPRAEDAEEQEDDGEGGGGTPVATAPCPSDSWNPEYPLFAAQCASVAWMRGVERDIRAGRNALRYAASVPLGDGGWVYDVAHECFSYQPQPVLLKARFKGAVLCDDVGTGKTACALALLRARDAAAARAPPSPPQLNVTHSGATLIVVPLALPAQWMDEVQEFTRGLRTVQLCSARDAKASSLAALVEADVVVTTTNFLRSRAYVDALDELLRASFGATLAKKRERSLLHAAARVVRLRPHGNASLFPLVELVHFERVIVDEVHEYFVPNAAARERLRLLHNLHARCWWGLTATPDRSRSEAIQQYYMFPAPKTPSGAEEAGLSHHPCLQAAVETLLLRSFSTSLEQHTETLHRVRLTAREHALFASYEPLLSEDEKVRLLCDARVYLGPRAASGSIDEIIAMVQEQRVAELREVEAFAAVREAALVEGAAAARQPAADTLKALRELDAAREQLEASLRFVDERLATLACSAHEECPICFASRPTCMTACGHLLCSACAGVLVGRGGGGCECPLCRRALGPKEIYEVTDAEQTSSKFRAVVDFVARRTAEGEKVILCSQWRSPAQELQARLEAAGVSCASLCGSTAQRASALRNFREGATSALFLQLERSSAGIHLTCATCVVFVHALVGSREEAATLEWQAIGRASRHGQTRRVEAHHFVYEGTVEEARWCATHAHH